MVIETNEKKKFDGYFSFLNLNEKRERRSRKKYFFHIWWLKWWFCDKFFYYQIYYKETDRKKNIPRVVYKYIHSIIICFF